jgi:hypothetical protein
MRYRGETKWQKSKNHQSGQTYGIVHELATFPGYATILVGFLAGFSGLAMQTSSLFPSVQQPPPPPVTSAAPPHSALLGVLAAAILASAIVLVLYAAWTYVESWTRRAMEYLCALFRVPAQRFFSFCFAILALIWLADAALFYFLYGGMASAIVALLAAAAVIIGGVSFGLAALLTRHP